MARSIPAVAAVLLLGCPAAAAGYGDQPPATTVKVCGPVVALTEHGCIGVKNGKDVFEITSVNPKPAIGDTVTAIGTPDPGAMTICMQGTHLTKVTWTKVNGCPEGEVGGP